MPLVACVNLPVDQADDSGSPLNWTWNIPPLQYSPLVQSMQYCTPTSQLVYSTEAVRKDGFRRRAFK
ncbi:hypothetical protein MPTK2_2g20230 [Marchantia polymorpha subsp. ruderalis]